MRKPNMKSKGIEWSYACTITRSRIKHYDTCAELSGGQVYQIICRADSRLAYSQWETSLQSNAISLAGRKPRINSDSVPNVIDIITTHQMSSNSTRNKNSQIISKLRTDEFIRDTKIFTFVGWRLVWLNHDSGGDPPVRSDLDDALSSVTLDLISY